MSTAHLGDLRGQSTVLAVNSNVAVIIRRYLILPDAYELHKNGGTAE